MRRFIKTLALMAVAVVGAASCTKDIADDTMNLTAEGVTLYATAPSKYVSTKVGFEDKKEEGIAMNWEDGDSFKLYNSNGDFVDTFTTTGDGKFTSSKTETKLVKDAQYTAKYNEDADLTEQDGDMINSLNSACQMEATFTYGNGEQIKFAHTKAIMTFTFKSDELPTYLVFENGEESYKVTYNELTPDDNGIYTSHIMIEPCDAIKRTLKFSLCYGWGYAYDGHSVESSIAYVKGMRYTAPINDITKWCDHAATEFADGDGSNGNPYKISTAAELALLAKNVNEGTESYSGKTFTLTEDINLSGYEWVAIGIDHSKSFQGIFNGAGHKITGLYIYQPYKSSQGIFGYTSGATIKNLSVSGTVTGEDYVGGIAGFAHEKSTIVNCYNNVSVMGNNNVGGVAGYSYTNCDIINCYNSGFVKGNNYAYVGGVVGKANESRIINCYNSGSMEGGSGAYIGGVIGYADDYTTSISFCYYQEGSGLQGVGNMTNAESEVIPMLATDMKEPLFVTTLNSNATKITGACAWKTGSNGYPVLDFEYIE